MWDRIKSFGWVTVLASIATAVVLGFAAAKSVNKKASGKRKEARAVDMMNSGISREIHNGKKMMEAANRDKDAALAADLAAAGVAEVAVGAADIGTGSGCVALSLAAERPDASVHAVDISPAAVAVATENARRLDLEGRVRFHVGDLLLPVRDLRGRVDLIVSNPPYLDPAGQSSLQPEVRDHEPRLALLAPEGPLALYARLVAASSAVLRAGGWLALEVGAGMAADIAALCTDSGFDAPRVTPDLQAIPRVLAAQKNG